jgi:hypothetical protein
MQSDNRRIEDSREIKGVRLRVVGVFGGVDTDQDFLDQARDLRVNYGDNMPRGYASRGGRIASEAVGQVGRVK